LDLHNEDYTPFSVDDITLLVVVVVVANIVEMLVFLLKMIVVGIAITAITMKIAEIPQIIHRNRFFPIKVFLKLYNLLTRSDKYICKLLT
jgi:hypothetical protein